MDFLLLSKYFVTLFINLLFLIFVHLGRIDRSVVRRLRTYGVDDGGHIGVFHQYGAYECLHAILSVCSVSGYATWPWGGPDVRVIISLNSPCRFTIINAIVPPFDLVDFIRHLRASRHIS